MIDLGAKDCKIIFYSTFFTLNLFLYTIDIFLFVAEQEEKFLREDVHMFGHKISKLRYVAACHRNTGFRDISTNLLLRIILALRKFSITAVRVIVRHVV